MTSDRTTATICWCFNEHGVESLALALPYGDTLGMTPCPIDGHPGTLTINVVDLTDGSDLAAHVREWLAFAAEPHDCLPSPICEVCGAEAGSVEQSMKNAVMRGRLGDD